MLWEISGTRNNQPIRAKVAASSGASARAKAEANGIIVSIVVAREALPQASQSGPTPPPPPPQSCAAGGVQVPVTQQSYEAT